MARTAIDTSERRQWRLVDVQRVVSRRPFSEATPTPPTRVARTTVTCSVENDTLLPPRVMVETTSAVTTLRRECRQQRDDACAAPAAADTEIPPFALADSQHAAGRWCLSDDR